VEEYREADKKVKNMIRRAKRNFERRDWPIRKGVATGPSMPM
jgi:hypothetical protein